MTTFDDREQAFEAKFAHDEEMRFRVQARRNKLLGLWAADLLGHSDAAAEAYASTIVTTDLQEPGEEDVLRKVSADLAGKVDESDVRKKMAELLSQAMEQMLAEA
ncbi:hypothetical protein PH5382_01289 [Phaeobacter sp. CECT 5382]|uniref:DUF1476 domain-containing protein n=1 Tax=Rhodobacterales TaxID=204455 RepID=UPI0006DAC962|nr:DUF1476 domain-containing protein [Phaeobacter sp. CECT 5382]CUH87362.1 hypothetical protein PH5382_01289 [Phaeobacter sp. CECT 5382]